MEFAWEERLRRLTVRLGGKRRAAVIRGRLLALEVKKAFAYMEGDNDDIFEALKALAPTPKGLSPLYTSPFSPLSTPQNGSTGGFRPKHLYTCEKCPCRVALAALVFAARSRCIPAHLGKRPFAQ